MTTSIGRGGVPGRRLDYLFLFSLTTTQEPKKKKKRKQLCDWSEAKGKKLLSIHVEIIDDEKDTRAHTHTKNGQSHPTKELTGWQIRVTSFFQRRVLGKGPKISR